jgi:transcriptional regulator with XRE-family HTH domain
VDPVRFGLAIRALRRRRGWSQRELAHRCGLSQSTISDIEGGLAFASTVDTIGRVVGGLGVRIEVRLLGHGEDIDRQLDASHADIVERVSGYLRRRG